MELRVKRDGHDNVDRVWEQVKWTMVESAKGVCDSVRVGGKNPKSVWWNDKVKAAVMGKEVLAAADEEAKERCMEAYREDKRKIKRCICQQKESK